MENGALKETATGRRRSMRAPAVAAAEGKIERLHERGADAASRLQVIGTAKLNDVDPQAWLADVLGRIAETPQSRLDELLPWNWVPEQKPDRAV